VLALLIRIYDVVLAGQTPSGFVSGLWFDVVAWLAVFGAVAIPALIIARRSAKVASTVTRLTLCVAAITAVLLSQYFASAGVLLAADFWGYSLSEISAAVGTPSPSVRELVISRIR
jgi:hypothetical protein